MLHICEYGVVLELTERMHARPMPVAQPQQQLNSELTRLVAADMETVVRVVDQVKRRLHATQIRFLLMIYR